MTGQRVGLRRGIAFEFAGERLQLRVPARRDLAAQPIKQMRLPPAEIHDQRRQPSRMKTEAKHVDRRSEKIGRKSRKQRRDALIIGEHRPVPVDRERRERLVRLEDTLHRRPRLRQRGIAERPLAVSRRQADAISPLGTAFVAAQAAFVAGLSLLEWIGLRRSQAEA